MVSDVPVGLFLSGGIDSSLIGALASQESEMPLQSFCITYPGHRYDESYFAQLASRTLGTEHHEYPFEPRNLEDTIQGVIRHFDQPLADKAALPLAYLSQKTAQSVKVVLTGDGGDELFAGYDKYLQANHPSPQNSFWHRLPDRWITSQNLMACAPDPFGFRRLKVRLGLKARPFWQSNYYKNAWEGWDRYRLYTDEIREKLGRQFEALDQMRKRPPDPQRPLEYMLALDQKAYLPDDLLLKTDYCTMAFGLEARAPFLDHLVAEAAARLPDALRVSAATGKIALRKLAARHLPTKLVQKPKRGFSVPLKRWFRNELKNWMVDCLVENSVTSGRYFRPQIVKQTVDQHLSGRQNHAQKLLTLIVFELWHRHYFQ
jgi:asparagine synthase (glutamine-hydrolysing)